MPRDAIHYLGRVKRAAHRDAYHYATIEPLVESDATGTQWVGPIRDAASRFPKRGLLHWHDAPPNTQVGALWQFTAYELPSDRADQFQVDDPHEPIEVVDFRGWSDETALRSTITGQGVSLPGAPLARRILLWLSSGICVGPLLLKAGSAPGSWTIEAPEAHRDAARMPVWRLASGDIDRVELDGGRWFVSPRLNFGCSAGIQNWTSDAQVARSVLVRLRKMDPEVVKAIAVTDNVFREYVDHVESGQMGSADPAVERARADRLRGVREAIKRDTGLLAEAAEALLATEVVRAEVEQKVESTIAEQVRARQSEIEAALGEATEQLARAQEDLDTKRTQVAQVNDELLAKRVELEQAVASFDQEVQTKLAEIARRPEKVFAETAVLRAVLAPLIGQVTIGRNDAREARLPIRPFMPAVSGTTDAFQELGDQAAVRGSLAAHAMAGSLSVHALLGLHAAFAAGIVPVVAGTDGYRLLRAYAFAAAGGRLHWIPIGSSTMEPYDLLGRFDGASYRIVPSSSGLLDVLRDAKHSGRLHVVVLEGFNRAPVEAYLSPILESAQASRAEDEVRAIPLASAALVMQDDPYGEMARLVWPANVLIACLPSDGSVTLPVPQSMWRFFALVDADDRDRSPIVAVSRGGAAPASTAIAPSLWKETVTNALGNAARDAERLINFCRALSLPRRDSDDACRLFGVLSSNGLPVSDATTVAASAILIPRFRGDANTIENAMRATGIAVPGWRTILAEAQRLSS